MGEKLLGGKIILGIIWWKGVRSSYIRILRMLVTKICFLHRSENIPPGVYEFFKSSRFPLGEINKFNINTIYLQLTSYLRFNKILTMLISLFLIPTNRYH